METVGEFAMELETERPDLFMGWGKSQPGEPGDYWLLLTQQPDAILAARIAALPAEVIVLVGPDVSSSALSEIKGALIMSLTNGHPDIYASARTSTDRFTSDITVEYWLTDTGRKLPHAEIERYEREALAAALQASRRDELPISVTFEEVAPRGPDCLEDPRGCDAEGN